MALRSRGRVGRGDTAGGAARARPGEAGRVSARNWKSLFFCQPLVAGPVAFTYGGDTVRLARLLTCTLVVRRESWMGWDHAASSPPWGDGAEACVAPLRSPATSVQCSPCTSAHLQSTLPLMEGHRLQLKPTFASSSSYSTFKR